MKTWKSAACRGAIFKQFPGQRTNALFSAEPVCMLRKKWDFRAISNLRERALKSAWMANRRPVPA
jgi:hypothetical protein